MLWITRIFGPPHELLHLLALRLIGRRPVAFTWTHVDIPPDLTLGQYIFVAGLPALVFWLGAAVGVSLLLQARDFGAVVIGIVIMLLGILSGVGTLGDLTLIIARWMEENQRLPPE